MESVRVGGSSVFSQMLEFEFHRRHYFRIDQFA